MFKQFNINTIEELLLVINIIKSHEEYKYFLLNGELGSGKTTFVKHFLPDYNITSPSFNIYQQYDNNLHCDLYNLKNNSSIFIEILEFFNQNNGYIFIEWSGKLPEYLKNILKPNSLSLLFNNTKNNRTLVIN